MANTISKLPETTLFSCETRRGLRNASFVLAIVLILVSSIASYKLYRVMHKPVFIPPEFEANVKTGTPDDSKTKDTNFEYLKVDENFQIGLCAKPYIEDNQLYLYFTNPVDNNYWLLVLLVNGSGAEIGRSGVIKPGEYIESVDFNENSIPEDVGSILIKIITYAPDTYESRGTVTLNPQIYANGYKSE